jgi:hypothetical protein
MKATIFFILMLFVWRNEATGQSCLTNGNFSNACSGFIAAPNGQCPTWTDACGGGWVRSHGSPQMIAYNNGSNSGFYAYMWSKGDGSTWVDGEGMYTPYSFSANHTYDINITISTSNVNGTVLVYAASGLTQSYYFGNCGGAPPTPSTKQLIGSYSGYTNGWITVPLQFTPSINYSQIWIYPAGTSVTTQYDLGVLNVSACLSCSETITYNNGSVPAGQTKAGIINVGSTAGIGGAPPVNVQPDLSTTLIAANEIHFSPEFYATVSTGNFSAIITPCSSTSSTRTYREVPNIKLYQSNESFQTESKDNNERLEMPNINIYPNPTRDALNVELGPNNAVVRLSVLNSSGTIIRTFNVSKRRNNIDINNLPSGIYFIQIMEKNGKVETRKFEKIK